ncbi:MAG: NUDIX domain-containing protein [Sandaracinaceae bacterium]
MTLRRSDIVYVVARLALDQDEYFLFIEHKKWGDWGLLGGHVEPDEARDWAQAAQRETEEEMVPLRVGEDVALSPIVNGPEQWGPEPSRSAGGEPTVYNAKWFSLTFLRDPEDCFSRMQREQFLLVQRERLEAGVDADVTPLMTRLRGALPNGLDDVPIAWKGSRLDLPTRSSAH